MDRLLPEVASEIAIDTAKYPVFRILSRLLCTTYKY
jgi:hypothetical protein